VTSMDINSLLQQMRSGAGVAGTALPEARAVADASAPNFADLLRQSVDAVNNLQMRAGDLTAGFERGAVGIDLPEVMVATQKAGITFQALTQVRNKFVNAYQEVMGMSI